MAEGDVIEKATVIAHLPDCDYQADILRSISQEQKSLQHKRDATILSISHRTVGKHLERVYEKLGVETRTAAATFILTSNPQL